MITKRQKQTLDFVKSFKRKKGYAPSLEEIRKHLRLSAVSTIHYHIKALVSQGYIKKEDNMPRAIDIYDKEVMVKIPMLGTIAAGKPIEAVEEKEYIAIPKSKLPRYGDFYALRVEGNSMVDENIDTGDVVIVKNQNFANNGQKVVVLLDNEEITLKKIYREKNKIRLQPTNESFEPIIIKNHERKVAVQGVVVDIIKNKLKSYEAEKEIRNKKFPKKHKKLPLNRIICGDAIEVMKQIPDYSIDLTVTSPPYDELRNYNGYRFNFEGIAKNLFRITKKGGILVWVVGDKIKNGNRSLTSFRQALFFQEIGFNIHDVMIYKKKNTPFMRTNAYTNCFEFMFVLSKDKPRIFNPLKVKTARQGQEMLPFNKGADGINKKILKELKPEKTMTNVWEYAVGLHGTTSDRIAFKHPAVFPEKLAEDHIFSWTKEGDIVFDPMCGSGTTCKMALKNNRFYIGCDISKEYVDLAIQRLKMSGI